MKFIILGLALVASVMADVNEVGYDYPPPAPPAPTYIPPAAPVHEAIASVPIPAPVAPKNTYIPPAAPAPAPVHEAIASVPIPAPVAPKNTYIPPAPAPVAPQNTYIPPAAPASAQLAEDGYHYRTVRRRVYRRRF